MLGSAYNLLILTIERLVASIFVDKYENLCSNVPLLGIFLTLAQVLLPMVSIYDKYYQWTVSTSIMYLAYQSIVSNKVLMVSIMISVLASIMVRVYHSVLNHDCFRCLSRFLKLALSRIREAYRIRCPFLFKNIEKCYAGTKSLSSC